MESSPFDLLNEEQLTQNDIALLDEELLSQNLLSSEYETSVSSSEVSESSDRGRNITIKQSDACREMAFGYTRKGGVYSFATMDRGSEGLFLHCVATMAGHEISSFEKLFIDDEEVTFGGGGNHPGDARWGSGKWEDHVFWAIQSTGADDQVANSDLVSQSAQLFPGLWTADHKQGGCALVYIILAYKSDLYKSWPPKIATEGYWNNKIYDPRTTSYGWSENAALITNYYLCDSRYGPKYDYATKVDEAALIDAADECDEVINGAEKRYTINGFFPVSKANTHQKILNEFKLCMGGSAADIVYTNGTWKILPAKWRAPTVTLTADDLRGNITWKRPDSRSKAFNAVKGTYFAPENNWESADYPAVFNTTYEEEDGERFWGEFDFSFIKYAAAAQRLGKLALEDCRQDLRLLATWSLKAMQVEVGENINILLEEYGWEPKVFKVLKYRDIERHTKDGPVDEVYLELEENAEGVFLWNDGEETTVDLAPNSNLPSPLVIYPPTGLVLASGTDELYQRSDGTVFSRLRVSWTLPEDFYVQDTGWYQIRYKKSSDSAWQFAPPVGGDQNESFILDVQDGETYDVGVRSVNGLGIKSVWVEEYEELVLGKLENPSTPTNFIVYATRLGIQLSWDKIADLDVSHYECRVGASWSLGTEIFADKVTSFNYPTQGTGVITFYLKAKDTSENYSNSAIQTLTVYQPGAVKSLTATVVHNLVELNWEDPDSSTFPISHYLIYRGATFAAAVLRGRADGSFKTLQETAGGTYTYWVVPVDVHGNTGTEASVPALVDDPPFFQLHENEILDPDDCTTFDYALEEHGTIVAPVVISESYEDHFINPSWDSLQDQDDAGYPYWIQPSSLDDAIIEWTKNYGSELSGMLVTMDYGYTVIAGSPTVTPYISHAGSDQSYTQVQGSQIFASDFQYIKPKLVVSANSDDHAVVRIDYVRLRLNVKLERDKGKATVYAADSSGTSISFNLDFVDVDSIRIWPENNDGNMRVADKVFVDVANPTAFDGFMWDKDGTRQTGVVGWEAWGVVAKAT